MKTLTAIAAIICTLTLPACAKDKTKEPAKDPAVLTEEQKPLHSLGVLMSQSIATFELTPAELAIVQQGLADGATGKKSAKDAQGDLPKIQELQRTRMSAASEKAAAAGVAFLEGKAKEAGYTKTASGMLVKHIKEGTGASPTATSEVKVHYEGKLIDGKVFDSSLERKEPVTFPLNGVIACWTEGVQTMKTGGKAELVCPANLAYGPNGSPPDIPPQATLVFQVELLEIVK
jgi:FKBP-type peptidyl-prolyl cis-trans isomerase FkpA